MDTIKTPSRASVVDFIYAQAETLGIDWRFHCNPDIDDLCDRGELAGVIPIVVYLPIPQALDVLNGTSSLAVQQKEEA